MFRGNLRGMRDRSVRSGTELARKIQLTDWSTVGNRSNRSSGVQIPRDICTRFGRYLYSAKCNWIISANKLNWIELNWIELCSVGKPKSLKLGLCRLSIRKLLSPCSLDLINSLSIPSCLKMYILIMWWTAATWHDVELVFCNITWTVIIYPLGS